MPVSLRKQGIQQEAPSVAAEEILVVPTKRRVRHLTRELLSEKRVSSALPIFTLESFAEKLFEGIFDGMSIIREPIQTLLFGQAIIASQNELRYFRVRSRYDRIPPGTLEKIVSVVKNLKEVGVTPAMLAEELLAEQEDEHPKLKDIVAIYSAYEASLKGLAAVDVEGLFTSLHLHCSLRQFERAFRAAFPTTGAVSIVGFDEFTEPELGFIQRLLSLPIEVSVMFDFQLGNDALFGHLSENYRRFLAMGLRPEPAGKAVAGNVLGGKRTAEVQETMHHLAANLFNRDGVAAPRECSTQITVAKAKDRTAEVELICKLIKHLRTQEPSLDLSRICVAMYRPQVYTHLMREQFAKYGIPANITDRYELAQSPVVVSLMGLLEVPMHGFRRDTLLRALNSAYIILDNDGVRVNAANLATISRELRIVGGVQTWLGKIEREITTIEEQAPKLADEEERAASARTVDRLKKAASDIRWLEQLLQDLGLEQTPAEFHRRLEQLLERVQVARQIVALDGGAGGGLVERDARAYAQFMKVVEDTVTLLEYQDGKELRHPLRFYVEQLKLAIAQERYNVREQVGEGVLITSIDETRGLPLDVMIVAGLVDGEFPCVYQSELFFSSTRMKQREQRHIWENRYLWYQALTNWTKHLYLTYPEQDAELDLVRSSFIDSLCAIADVEQWTYPGASPLEHILFCEEDYIRQYGKMLPFLSSQIELVPDALQQKLGDVEKACAVENSRVERHDLPEYEGLIGEHISAEARQELQQLKQRVFSASQLESYGKCPYQFFAHRLLRLNVLEELEEEFSAVEKGSIVHEVLFEFYTERREKNLPSLRHCSEKEFAEARERLLHIAGQKLASIDIPDAFWDLEKELILGEKETGRGILSEFLQFERNRSTSFHPAFFEVGFGAKLGAQTRIDPRMSSEEPVLAGNVRLGGKVDRVEMKDDAFAIVDYKTGTSLPSFEDIRAGMSLQLPLYLYAVEQLLAQHQGRSLQPAGGIYYQIRNPIALKLGLGSAEYEADLDAGPRKSLQPSNDELRKVIDASIHRVNSYIEDMTKGKFPLTSHDSIEKVCTYCDYKTICRIQTVRRLEKAKTDNG